MEWIQNNLTTIIIGVVLLLVIFKGAIIGKVFGIKNISATELASKIKENPKDVVIIDVRTPQEHSSGYIRGSKLIPMSELSSKMGSLNSSKNKVVAVICASGGRSIFSATSLKKAGFNKVYNVSGGIASWKRHGYDVVQ